MAMTKIEAEEFLAGITKEGLYLFKQTLASGRERNRLRKFTKSVWYSGYRFQSSAEERRKAESALESIVSGKSFVIEWLVKGCTVEYYCDLAGNKPITVFEPTQLGLFE